MPRTRRGTLAAAAIGLLGIGTVALLLDQGVEWRSRTADPHPGGRNSSAGESSTRGEEGESVPLDGHRSLAELEGSRERDGHRAPADDKSQKRFLVVGQLEHSRVIAFPFDTVREEAAKGPQKTVSIQAASATVGGPLWLRAHGEDLLIVATNHAQFVRLRRDWKTRDVLDIAPAVRLDVPIEFGPILPVDKSTVVLPVTDAWHFALARVDLAGWRVEATRKFTDRSAVFSSACEVGAALYVSTDGWIDKYDARTLQRTASVRISGDWASAMACARDAVYGVSSRGAVGWAFDPRTLERTGRFTWKGVEGGDELLVDGDELLGTDSAAGRVFSCDRRTLRCRVSDEVAVKPTNLVLDGPSIFVTAEANLALVVLDRKTLRKEGTLALPGRPRGLAILSVG